MPTIDEIIDKVLGPAEGEDEMPVAARKLIPWLDEMKKRSKGTFHFETKKNKESGSMHIALTFKVGPTAESEAKVEIAVNNSVILDRESYSGHGVYGPYGRNWRYNTQDETIAEVVDAIANRIAECKKAIVPGSSGPALVREIARVPVIRRGLPVGPRR